MDFIGGRSSEGYVQKGESGNEYIVRTGVHDAVDGHTQGESGRTKMHLLGD